MADKPKRPMSAYMLWFTSAREQIKSEHPGLNVTEIARKGAEIWRGMKDKSIWEEKAMKAKEQYTKDLESYNANGGSETPIVAGTDKTPEAVGFCDSCNVVVPVTEHSSHLRMRNHALALLNEQIFEELVQSYGGEGQKLEPTEPTDDGAFVDETEATNTYTCHLCDLEVPQVFKTEHERGSWHRASRILTLAAARRARDTLSARSDGSYNGHKFTGKMMKKLLKAYRGYDEDKSDIEEAAETESTKPEPKRLTAKQYFTDILPYLPYVGSFCSLIIDDTEFVTIQISNETLKIHVNNFNGLYNFEGNGGNYMNCRLCDGFSNVCYGSVGHQDKLHVMSLGHIKNVLSPVDSVHLIRKIGDTHSICGLCNMHMASHLVDSHILKDARHTMALSEALDRGKQYKENKDNLNITIFTPQSKKQSIFMKPIEFNNSYSRPTQTQQRHLSGSLFGSGQNTGFVGVQNTGHFSGQNTGFVGAQNTGHFSGQNTGFVGAQNTAHFSGQNTGFGSKQNAGFTDAQNTGLGSSQVFGAMKGSIFGAAQTQSHVAQQNPPTFGFAQNSNLSGQSQGQSGWSNSPPTNQNTTFGDSRNSTGSFGNPQNSSTGFDSQNKNTENNTATFGAAQGNAPGNSGESQTSAVFASAQNTGGIFGNAQLKDRFPDQINKSPESSVCDQKSTPTNNNVFRNIFSSQYPDPFNPLSLRNADSFNRPDHVVNEQDSKPIGLHSAANSGDSQNTLNAQSPSQTKGNVPEQAKKFGDAPTQSKNDAYAQINKPISTIQSTKPNCFNYSSSSSDSD